MERIELVLWIIALLLLIIIGIYFYNSNMQECLLEGFTKNQCNYLFWRT
jgi:hypothetical protein